MYRSIMVPVDLAEAELAQPAIAAAVSFAKISGGRVRLVYVRSLIPITYMEFVPADFDTEQQEDAEAKLAEVKADAGMLFQWGALDFAGGTVVHINAGIAGLVGCLVIGKRIGYGKELMPPH